MSSGAALSRAPSGPLFSRNGSQPRTLEEITREWSCKKRDGSIVPFDSNKIRKALTKCFTAIADPAYSPPAVADVDDVVYAVLNSLRAQKKTCPEVEEVQRLVIQQLWAKGLFEAAEHYQNYREAHRQARLAQTVDPAYAAAIAEDLKRFPNPLQFYQFISKFARWRDDRHRRETWREACDRTRHWFQSLPRVAGKLTDAEWAELDASLYNMETCCAMRVLQMAGPALERDHTGCFNCWFVALTDLRCFAELLYVLMAGGGCGFSVEDQFISQLPRIAYQKNPPVKHTYIVPDTTDGWCDALLFGLERWFAGEDVWFDVANVRPAGVRLKIKGGRASGSGPLLELLNYARSLIMARQGKVLTDIDCHDLACMIGKIVQVGGVRRAATISMSDLDSPAMRDAKSGNWYHHARQRTMANNSAVYDGRPDIDTFLAELSALVRSKSGERGIFNVQAAFNGMPCRRQRRRDIRTNPCGEVLLRSAQPCNLSIVVARHDDTRESLRHKVRLATIWGCMQKTATNFKYLRPLWQQNAEEEALLGVDITGHADCPLLRFGAPGRAELLRELKQIVLDTDIEFSNRFGVNRAAAATCVKPSGDSAAMFDCASGVSPWFHAHIQRWVREQAVSPVAKFLQVEGVPHAPAPEDPSLLVFGFLREAPAGATTKDQMTAIDQLENWLEWKENWAEHSVSCTVYVDEHEWPAVMAWVYDHFDKISGVSFLPRDNGRYTYAPNEALSPEQYAERRASFPSINWAKLCHFEDEDQTTSAQTAACTSGACEV